MRDVEGEREKGDETDSEKGPLERAQALGWNWGEKDEIKIQTRCHMDFALICDVSTDTDTDRIRNKTK